MRLGLAAAGGASTLIARGALTRLASVRAVGLDGPATVGAGRWTRINYAGRTVSLAAGPAVAVGSTLACALGAPRKLRAPAVLIGLAAGAAGWYDDVIAPRIERAGDKGLAGHLRALRAGRPSGGVVKAAAIGAAAVAGAGPVSRSAGDRFAGAGVIAASANLLNLLDLRPARALKAAVAVGSVLLPGPAGRIVAGPVGAAVAALPADLGERQMLGDTGANTLGALLGLAFAAVLTARGRWIALGALSALTAASEVVSFSQVIDRTPPLAWLDAVGRRAER
jgi:hypothetical protein